MLTSAAKTSEGPAPWGPKLHVWAALGLVQAPRLRARFLYIFIGPLAGSKQSRRKCLTPWFKGILRKMFAVEGSESKSYQQGHWKIEQRYRYLWLATQNQRHFHLSLCSCFPFINDLVHLASLFIKIKSLTLKNPASWVMSATESPGEIKCLINVQHAFQCCGFACSDFYYGGALKG